MSDTPRADAEPGDYLGAEAYMELSSYCEADRPSNDNAVESMGHGVMGGLSVSPSSGSRCS